MPTIIGNLLSTVLVFFYINVGLVNGQDKLYTVMEKIGQEYVDGVGPCRIIRNAYNNNENEMKHFRNIQQKCKSMPRIVGFNEACKFLMKSIHEDEDIRDEEERLTRNRFIRRVYFSLSSAVRDTPLDQLSHMHVMDGLMTNGESSNSKKRHPATAVCQHWSTMADLCRGDNDEYKFGIYEVGTSNYCRKDMEKVLAACRALGLRSTLSLPSSQASSSG